MTTALATETAEARYRNAFATLRKALRPFGGTARMNVRECCPSCVTPNKLGASAFDAPFVFSFGGKTKALHFDTEDRAWTGIETRSRSIIRYNPTVHVYHQGAGVAQLAVDVFTAAGFNASWDGSEYSAVVIQF